MKKWSGRAGERNAGLGFVTDNPISENKRFNVRKVDHFSSPIWIQPKITCG